MSKTQKWATGIFLAPIIIILLLAVAIYLPPIQNWAVQKVTAYASEKMGMEISVDHVCLVFPLDLGVDGVKIIQPNDSIPQKKDTIADLKRAVVDVRLFPLFAKRVEIDRLDIYDLKMNTANLVHEARVKGTLALLSLESHGIDLGKETLRLDMAMIDGARLNVALSDTVPPDTTESKNFWKINLDKLDVRNSDVTVHMPGDTLQVKAVLADVKAKQGFFDLYKGQYDLASIDWKKGEIKYDNNFQPRLKGLDANHIALSDIHLGIDSLHFCSPDLSVVIRQCKMKEKSGIVLASLTGKAVMDSTRLHLHHIAMKTPTSDLQAEVALDLNVMDEKNPGQMNADISASLSKEDLLLAMGDMPVAFRRQWPAHPLSVKAKMKGNMRHVDVSEAMMELPGAMKITAKGKADYPTDMEKIKADFHLDATTYNLAFVSTLLSSDLQRMIAIPSTHAVADLKMDGKAVNVSFDVAESRGKMVGKAYYNADTEAYTANIDAKSFQIQHYVKGMNLGGFTGKAELKGKGTDFFSPYSTLTAKAEVSDFKYDKWNLNNMSLVALLENGRARVNLTSRNDMIDGTVILDALMSRNPIRATLISELNYADLHRLQIAEAPLTIGGCAHIDIASDLKDYYMLQGTVGDVTVRSAEQTYRPDDMVIDLLTRRDTTHAVADCGDFHLRADVSGGYKYILGLSDRMAKEMARQWNDRVIDGDAFRKTLPKSKVFFTMGQENPVARGLKRYDFAVANMYADFITSPESGINGELHIDTLKTEGMKLDRFVAKVTSDETDIRYRLDIENDTNKPKYGFRATALGMFMPNAVSSDVVMTDLKGRKIISLSSVAEMEKEGIRLSFAKQKQIIGYKDFTVNDDNYVFLSKDMRVSADMVLRADDGTGMQIYTDDNNLEALQDVTFSLHRIDLGAILPAIPYMPKVSGIMDGDFHVIQTANDLSVSSSVEFQKLIYEDCPVGNISSEFVYIPMEDGTHHIDGILIKDGLEVANISGGYNPENEGTIDLVMNLQKLPLDLANGFIPDQLIGLEGTGDGTITVKGSVAHPDVNGEVFLQDASLISVPYGVKMKFDDDPVRIVGSKLLLENFQMYANNNQPLLLMGDIDFGNTDHIAVNLRMRGNNMLVIDAKETRRSEAYGKAYVNFYGMLTGELAQLKMRGKLEVLPTTDLYYILRDSPITTDNRLKELVTFTDLDVEEHHADVPPSIDGLNMDLSVDVNDGAHITCWLNTNHTNYLDILGGGELRMRYISDEIRLTGRYTIYSGEMKYSLPVIPLKSFSISEGSYLEFTGDMMNPRLNITALEETRATVDINGVNQVVLFKCGVAITKTLQDMGLEFLIDAPENQTISDELQAKSIEERGKLAVTMLTTGMYLSENNTSAFTMNSALSAFLQSEINSIAGSALRTLDLSVGLENSTDETGHMHTDYAFKFAKRFWNNRLSISVGGKISTGPDVSGQNNSFFDNVELQYRTSDTSNQYLRLFYKRAVYDFLEGYVGQYGGGYMWKRKLQHFKDIFRTKVPDTMPMRSAGSVPAVRDSANAVKATDGAAQTPAVSVLTPDGGVLIPVINDSIPQKQ